MTSVLHKYLRVTMPDGSRWDVPIAAIALSRAESYKEEFGGNRRLSLLEDTAPLFESSSFQVKDWAANNMNWDEVSSEAKLVRAPQPSPDDLQEGWVNGDKEIVD